MKYLYAFIKFSHLNYKDKKQLSLQYVHYHITSKLSVIQTS